MRDAFEILRAQNNFIAGFGNWLLIGLTVAALLVVFCFSAKTGFERQSRAYEIAGRV